MKSIIKKQRLFFVSLIGIVVVSLALVTTYAYQTLQVEYKGKEDLTVNAGVLDVTFKSTRRINMTNMPLLSNYSGAPYTEFVIDNSNSTGEVVYKIRLTDLEYSSELVTSDFKYTIVRVDENNNLNVIGEGDFTNLSNNEYDFITNSGDFIKIDKGKKDKIRLYLWLKETEENQNYLEKTSFKGIIEINSIFASDLKEEVFTKFNIYGNTVITYKEGTEEQSLVNPITVSSLGTLVNDENDINNGKYKISISNNKGLETSIYLNEPLRCIGDVCDYIDVIKRSVVRRVGVKELSDFEWVYDNNKFITNINELNIKNDIMFTEITKYDNTIYSNNGIELSIMDINSIEEFNNYISANDVNLYYQLNIEDSSEKILADLYSVINRNITVSDGNIEPSNIEIN